MLLRFLSMNVVMTSYGNSYAIPGNDITMNR